MAVYYSLWTSTEAGKQMFMQENVSKNLSAPLKSLGTQFYPDLEQKTPWGIFT